MTKRSPTVAVGPLAMLLAITAATIAHAATDPSASAVPTLTPIPPTPASIAPRAIASFASSNRRAPTVGSSSEYIVRNLPRVPLGFGVPP